METPTTPRPALVVGLASNWQGPAAGSTGGGGGIDASKYVRPAPTLLGSMNHTSSTRSLVPQLQRPNLPIPVPAVLQCPEVEPYTDPAFKHIVDPASLANPAFRPRIVFHQPLPPGGLMSSKRQPVFHEAATPYQEPDTPASGEEVPLVFDATMESGNLAKVVQTGLMEYDLILRNDLNTSGFTQWFYFAVGNTHPASPHMAVCQYCGGTKVRAADMDDSIDSPVSMPRLDLSHCGGDTAPPAPRVRFETDAKPPENCDIPSVVDRESGSSRRDSPDDDDAASVSTTRSSSGSDSAGESDGEDADDGDAGTSEEPDGLDLTSPRRVPIQGYRAREKDGYTCPHTHSFVFNIINMRKAGSLFNEGMQPVMYSLVDATLRDRGWHRAGANIRYFENGTPKQKTNSSVSQQRAGKGLFTLTFTMTFHNPGDVYLIAMSPPFTMTDQMQHIERLLAAPRSSHCIRSETLCKTLWGQDCPLLTITDWAGLDAEPTNRRVIVLTGRVHPGETGASWMMRGITDFLTSDVPRAVALRKTFIFKIVPMLNPDGVAVGNNRASLSGADLNRTWAAPDPQLHPTIACTKALMHAYGDRVVFYCDLHSHSRQHGVFLYGVNDKPKAKPAVVQFSSILAANVLSKGMFSLHDCHYEVHKSREGTARVVVARELKVPLSFTLEASFSGSRQTRSHFSVHHLHRMGQALVDSLAEFFNLVPADCQTEAVPLVTLGETDAKGFDNLFVQTTPSSPMLSFGDTSAAATPMSVSAVSPTALNMSTTPRASSQVESPASDEVAPPAATHTGATNEPVGGTLADPAPAATLDSGITAEPAAPPVQARELPKLSKLNLESTNQSEGSWDLPQMSPSAPATSRDSTTESQSPRVIFAQRFARQSVTPQGYSPSPTTRQQVPMLTPSPVSSTYGSDSYFGVPQASQQQVLQPAIVTSTPPGAAAAAAVSTKSFPRHASRRTPHGIVPGRSPRSRSDAGIPMMLEADSGFVSGVFTDVPEPLEQPSAVLAQPVRRKSVLRKARGSRAASIEPPPSNSDNLGTLTTVHYNNIDVPLLAPPAHTSTRLPIRTASMPSAKVDYSGSARPVSRIASFGGTNFEVSKASELAVLPTVKSPTNLNLPKPAESSPNAMRWRARLPNASMTGAQSPVRLPNDPAPSTDTAQLPMALSHVRTPISCVVRNALATVSDAGAQSVTPPDSTSSSDDRNSSDSPISQSTRSQRTPSTPIATVELRKTSLVLPDEVQPPTQQQLPSPRALRMSLPSGMAVSRELFTKRKTLPPADTVAVRPAGPAEVRRLDINGQQLFSPTPTTPIPGESDLVAELTKISRLVNVPPSRRPFLSRIPNPSNGLLIAGTVVSGVDGVSRMPQPPGHPRPKSHRRSTGERALSPIVATEVEVLVARSAKTPHSTATRHVVVPTVRSLPQLIKGQEPSATSAQHDDEEEEGSDVGDTWAELQSQLPMTPGPISPWLHNGAVSPTSRFHTTGITSPS